MKTKLLFISLIIITASCGRRHGQEIYSDYKPVLMATSAVYSEIGKEEVRNFKLITSAKPLGNFLLSLDYGLGIHVTDISNPALPSHRYFFKIPGCIDFKILNNVIYANNLNDLLVIDFTDKENPVIVKRTKDAFNITVKAPDGLKVYNGLDGVPENTTIISYEKIFPNVD